MFLAITLSAFLFGISIGRPLESARRYQYRVVAVSSVNELRTQSDAEQGRVKTIENIINEQVTQGWEFFEADGLLLYFRR
jgi:hypothetical protein